MRNALPLILTLLVMALGLALPATAQTGPRPIATTPTYNAPAYNTPSYSAPAYGAPRQSAPPYRAPGAAPVAPGLAAPETFSQHELVDAGHAFFGETSAGLSGAIENLLSRFGEPNGYVLGEEASGAIFGGLRYGEGTLHTANMGKHPVFWQGPSFGWDLGGSGTRVMMMVYELQSVDAFMQRFTGVDGSAYLVGGLSVTVMAADNMVLVPVRTGVGARLGVSLGYLKFTRQPTWNPF